MAGMRQALSAILLLLLILSAAPLGAQERVRVQGTIEKVEGNRLTVASARGGQVQVELSPGVAVFGVVAATLADVKPGSFIGVGAMPQPDGSQLAIQVMIFAETQRGLGEGHRPWSQPGSTMTNATVETTVSGVQGQVLSVKYKGGEQRIVVPSEATIRAYVAGHRDELKPGAPILIVQALRRADGVHEAARVNVGRGGIVP